VTELTSAQLQASCDFARRAIRDLPDGVYTASHNWKWAQGGHELDMDFELTVTVDDDRLIVDLSGMPPQVALPINAGAIGEIMRRHGLTPAP